jgi:hypothetical protein
MRKDQVMVVLECYFDGSNQANSQEYDVLTLGCIAGTEEQWRKCLSKWGRVLKDNGADYLHTTDAVNLHNAFSRKRGWNKTKRDKLLFSCVEVALDNFAHLRGQSPSVAGLLPHTTTINLKDHDRARKDQPGIVPPDANEICALQAMHSCFKWARHYEPKIDGYRLVFDQKEPFRGHIWDRYSNPKVRKRYPDYAKIIKISEADMRFEAALQVADLLAWCVSHQADEVKAVWHEEMLSRPWMQELGTYDKLVKPVPGALNLWRSFNLPKRRIHP